MIVTPERLQTLIAALDDPHVSVGWNACRELAKMGKAANFALPALSEAMKRPDANTALWARYAVARITGDIPKHLPVFLEALTNKRLYPGMAAAALAGFGKEAAPAVPLLIVELSDANAENRWSAAWALAAIGPDAAASVPELARLLSTDTDEKVRWYAAYALSAMGPSAASAVPALLAALNDFDDDVRGYAIKALGNSKALEAAPVLTTLLTDENENLRHAAGAALSQIQEKV